jgi:hypothetical protein
MKVQLLRSYTEKQTPGGIYIDGKEVVKTLELPWKNNKKNISCIPEGSYTVRKRPGHEKRPYEHFHIMNVPGRAWILIHPGTYVWNVLGCIMPGLEFADLNRDGLVDVIHSKTALKKLLELLPGEFTLTIEPK